ESLNLLQTYRKLAWDKKEYKTFRQTYYAILSSQARISGRSGEMLYYAEKLNELELQDTTSPSLNAVAIYYNAHFAFSNTIALFYKYQNALEQIPRMVLAKQLERRKIMRSTDMLSYLAMATYQVKD